MVSVAWEPTVGGSETFMFYSFPVVLCRVRLAYLSSLSFLLISVSHTVVLEMHALHMLPFCFPFSWGWLCTFCTRCIFMINHVRYLECFGIMVLAGPSELCRLNAFVLHLFAYGWLFGPSIFMILFIILVPVPNSSFPLYHANHHTKVRISFLHTSHITNLHVCNGILDSVLLITREF